MNGSLQQYKKILYTRASYCKLDMSVQGIAMANITRGILYGKNVIPMIHAYLGERMFCQKTPDQPESDLKPPIKTAKEMYQEYVDQQQDELRNAIPYEKMPKLPMLPLFGSSWLYFPRIGKYSTSNMPEVDLKKKNTYGDIVRERIGKFEIVSSYDPIAAELLGVYEGRYPIRAEMSSLKTYREMRKFYYDVVGLVSMQGPEWRDLRFKVQKYAYVYHPKGYQMVLNIATDAMKLIEIQKDSNNEIHDLTSLLKKWALESVVAFSLDTRLNCLDPNIDPESDGMKMIESVQTQLACMNKLEPSFCNYPFWRHFPTPTWNKFVKSADVFTELVFKCINNSMRDFFINAGGGKNPTLLQSMLMDKSLEVSATMVAVADLIMAGIDTTSHTAAYFLFCLAKNPEKQEKLYQEIIKEFPDKEKMMASYPSKYYTMCFDESVRLYPVVRGNLRIFDRDVVIQKYKIPAGVAVLSVYQIFNRDPKYFDRPNEFIPERFEVRRSQIPIRPFGIGKRQCLGRLIATKEIFAIITEVLRNYRVESIDDDIKLVSRLVNVPDRPIRMKFIKR